MQALAAWCRSSAAFVEQFLGAMPVYGQAALLLSAFVVAFAALELRRLRPKRRVYRVLPSARVGFVELYVEVDGVPVEPVLSFEWSVVGRNALAHEILALHGGVWADPWAAQKFSHRFLEGRTYIEVLGAEIERWRAAGLPEREGGK